jgi:hypothetical protein
MRHMSNVDSLMTRLLLLCFALTISAFGAESFPPIQANQNHVPAGVLRGGVLIATSELTRVR